MKTQKRFMTWIMTGLLVAICVIGVLTFLRLQNASNSTVPPKPATTEEVLTNAEIGPDVLAGLQLSERQTALLKDFIYYQGTVTVDETQNWASKGIDRSSAEGAAKLVSNEILIYDPKTDRSYILARTLNYESLHHITVNDLQGDYLGQSQVNGSGQMTEYYGMGLLMKKASALRSVSKDPAYEINFTMNPLRIDTTNGSLYTYPLPNKADWVTYTSTTEATRLGGAKLWTPEFVRSQPMNLVPELLELSDNQGYSLKTTAVFAEPNRVFKPMGSVQYQYKNIPLSEALSAVLLMKEQSEFVGTYEARVKGLESPWTEMAQLVDQWVVIEDASSTLDRILVSVSPKNIKKADSALATLDLIANNDILQEQVDRLSRAIEAVNSDNGVLNRLKKAFDAMDSNGNSTEPMSHPNVYQRDADLIMELMMDYASTFEAINSDIAQLRTLTISNEKVDEVTVERYYLDGQDQMQTLKALNQRIYSLISVFDGALYDLRHNPSSAETDAHEMDRILVDFEEALLHGEDGTAIPIDLPEGFPQILEVLFENSSIAVAGTVEGDAGDAGYAVTYKTDLAADELAAVYKTQLQAMDQLTITRIGDLTTLTFVLSPYNATVLIMPNTLGGNEKTMVQIVLKTQD